MQRTALTLILLCSASASVAAQQASLCSERVDCYQCAVARHIDGDTFEVWCGGSSGNQSASLRLFGIDTPEKGDRAKCDAERAKGEAASAFLAQWMPVGSFVEVMKVDQDRYGRWVGLARFRESDVSAELSWRGYARPWSYKTPKPNWCD